MMGAGAGVERIPCANILIWSAFPGDFYSNETIENEKICSGFVC